MRKANRVNVTMDAGSAQLLRQLAETQAEGNASLLIRLLIRQAGRTSGQMANVEGPSDPPIDEMALNKRRGGAADSRASRQ
jgi:hypothetical protein